MSQTIVKMPEAAYGRPPGLWTDLPLKITFVLPFASLAGGVRIVATYAWHLTKMGHEVTVISQPAKIPRRKGLRLIRDMITRSPRKNPEGHPTPLLDFLGPRHVILDHPRPPVPDDFPDGDVVVATWWETAEWVSKLPLSKGRKFYLLQEYETFDNQPIDRVIATYRLPLQKLAVSSYIADTLATNHNCRDVDIVPNAIDTTVFDAPPRARNEQITVGFLYTPSLRKQVALAIEATTRARSFVPDLKVVAFGANPPVEKFPLPDWVNYHLKPPQNVIPKIYASCDIWLFTSSHEGFGLPILEAMACRTPVLATPAGAAPDLIDQRNGMVLTHDPDSFVEQIVRIAQMPRQDWVAMSNSAHKTAHSYRYEDATRALLATFSKTHKVE